MKKLYLIFILFLILGLQSCVSKKQKINFNGELSHCKYSKIYLYKVTPTGTFVIDSSEIIQGKFSLTDNMDQYSDPNNYPCFYKVFLTQKNHILTIASMGESLHFKANADSLVKTYHVSGGHDAQLLNQLDIRLKMFVDSVETLYDSYETNQYNDSVKVMIETKYNKLVENHQKYLLDFIHTNKESLVTLTAFYQTFNRRIFFPEKENIPLLTEMYLSLKVKYPKNDNISYIKSRIEKYSQK